MEELQRHLTYLERVSESGKNRYTDINGVKREMDSLKFDIEKFEGLIMLEKVNVIKNNITKWGMR